MSENEKVKSLTGRLQHMILLSKLGVLMLLIGVIAFCCLVKVSVEEADGRRTLRFQWRLGATATASSSGTHNVPATPASNNAPAAYNPAVNSTVLKGGGVPPIRIGTIQLGELKDLDYTDGALRRLLTRIILQADIVAVQGIRSRNETVPALIVSELNKAAGAARNYDFAAIPRTLRDPNLSYGIFLFDTKRIEIDRSTIVQVDDPGRRIAYRPLMAQFRVKGPRPDEAFTFKLVNVNVCTHRAYREAELVDDIYLSVWSATPKEEDDVIMVGDFGMNEDRLEELREQTGLASCAPGIPDPSGQRRRHNDILFDFFATVEFTGRSELIDPAAILKSLGIPPEKITKLPLGRPMWAQFSAYEGGQAAGYFDRTAAMNR